MPNSRATRSLESRLRLATLTISTPGTARSPGMCFRRVFAPAPTIPTRIVSFGMVSPFETHLSKGKIEVKNAAEGGVSTFVAGVVCEEAEESVVLEGALDEFAPVAEQGPLETHRFLSLFTDD